MTPEALRRRMAHGNIYPAEKVDAALANYFRVGQPRGAARAGAAVGRRPGRRGARRSTGRPTASPGRGRRASGSSSRSPARPAATTLIRRAARMAARGQGRAARRARPRRPTACAGPPATLLERAPRAARGARRRRTTRSRRRRRRRPGPVRPGRERHPARARAPAVGRAGRELLRGSVINNVHPRVRATSTSTSSPPTRAPTTRSATRPTRRRRRPGGARAVAAAPARRLDARRRRRRRCSRSCSPTLRDTLDAAERPAAVPAASSWWSPRSAASWPALRVPRSPASCSPTGSSRRPCTTFTIAEGENLLALVDLPRRRRRS